MSALTECNWHILQWMKEKAEERGVEVVLAPAEDGWLGARYSDEEEPAALFMQLTDHCVC